jgi:ParB-like chromosome segregation protein Spo0J
VDALGAWENVDAPGVLGSVFNQVGALGGGEVSKTDWPASKVEMRNVSELVPYANNSRTHSPQQVDQIAASINEWGWTVPVLVDEKGMLIAGHGRIMAAQKLGIEQVPTMTAKGWTEAQKKAYAIADNKLTLNADWNMELLNLELQELQELDFDLELTGFSLDEIGGGIDLGDHSERKLDSEKYTAKIETPIYEMKGDKPEVSEIYDTAKTEELSSRIMKADLPDDIRDFLMAAATRHTVFNYERIAEFYAHQDREVQELMEQSALVIIDYNKAIENGYVKLTKALMHLSRECDDVAE